MPAPKAAGVVVIGAGAFGAATAYHLARRGADVVVLDQHAPGSQTSPRAAGLTSKADKNTCATTKGEDAMPTVDWSYHRNG